MTRVQPRRTTAGSRPAVLVAVVGALALVVATGAVVSPAGAQEGDLPFPGFPDVAPGTFYEEPAYWLEDAGLTTGVGDTGDFQPQREITRGEVATFLWRFAGEPEVGEPAPFVDIGDGAFYDAAVRWLAAEDLTTGVGGSDRFEPDRSVTRGEVATFLWRYADEPSVAEPAPFPDVEPGDFFATPVAWLAEQGLTFGVGDTGQFQPNRPITRGEYATFLWRYEGTPPAETPRLISTFTTPLVPGAARNTNIQLASSIIDGTVIEVGDSFSLNAAIGERTRARGFVEDGFITGGDTTDAVGGGVSQVSTNVLNAAWFAGIRIDQFRPHTIYFERYPMCREATIVWDVLDLVVTNDTVHHLWLRADATESEATVSLFSFPFWSVESWTSEPYAIDESTGVFSVDCGRTISLLGETVEDESYTWRYVNGGYPG